MVNSKRGTTCPPNPPARAPGGRRIITRAQGESCSAPTGSGKPRNRVTNPVDKYRKDLSSWATRCLTRTPPSGDRLRGSGDSSTGRSEPRTCGGTGRLAARVDLLAGLVRRTSQKGQFRSPLGWPTHLNPAHGPLWEIRAARPRRFHPLARARRRRRLARSLSTVRSCRPARRPESHGRSHFRAFGSSSAPGRGSLLPPYAAIRSRARNEVSRWGKARNSAPA
jgi:hypothetical protein